VFHNCDHKDYSVKQWLSKMKNYKCLDLIIEKYRVEFTAKDLAGKVSLVNQR
jgi:hypothetical protein